MHTRFSASSTLMALAGVRSTSGSSLAGAATGLGTTRVTCDAETGGCVEADEFRAGGRVEGRTPGNEGGRLLPALDFDDDDESDFGADWTQPIVRENAWLNWTNAEVRKNTKAAKPNGSMVSIWELFWWNAMSYYVVIEKNCVFFREEEKKKI
jgi:hypothetical protein